MRAIILAAGTGTRLGSLTADRPKCMVELQGVPLIDRTLAVLRAAGIDDVIVITGYRDDCLRDHLKGQGVRFCHNGDYASTNMVASLLTAREFFDQESLISYADIVYTPAVVKALIRERAPLALTYDTDWHTLWSMRMEDPLLDAETFKTDADGYVEVVGGKPRSLSDIQGQYMGLIRANPIGFESLVATYERLGRPPKLQMTELLQAVTAPIKGIAVSGGWVEVDTPEDLLAYKDLSWL